jgi:hypothetical protein
MDALKVTGDFEAETNTRSEATGEVLRLIVGEFWRLQRERVGERELADAKAYMTGSFPLTIETPDAIAMQVVNVVFYGLPLDQLQSFRERVNAVTVDDIQRVARAYLRPDRLSVVLVGNASAFAAQLGGAGFGTYETVELSDLDLLSSTFKRAGARSGPAVLNLAAGAAPDRRRAAYVQTPSAAGAAAAAAQGAGQLSSAQALVDRAVAAKGGLDTLRSVKTIIVKQTLTSPAADRDNTIETTTYIQYPDRFRTETTSPTGGAVNVQGYDGNNAWLLDQRGVRDQPPAVLRDARTTLRRDPIALLLAAESGAMNARLLPDVKDAAGRVNHALELSAPDFNPVVLLIDPATSGIRKMTFVADVPGRPIVEDEFTDYRPVSGVQIAFQASRRSGPQTIARRITDITINAPIDPALFKRPS